MSEKWITAIVSVAVGIVGLAAVAALLSKNSDTVKVIGAGSNGLACILCSVIRPLGINCPATCGGTDLTEVVTSQIHF